MNEYMEFNSLLRTSVTFYFHLTDRVMVSKDIDLYQYKLRV